tara:strand:- start:167 stop:397 length:231 start_codon:yes stop_codon:yes gene_type:complete
MNIVLSVLKFVLNILWTISIKNICLWVVLGWHWMWSKTSIDEKAIAAVKETARRAHNVKEELGDVVDAAKGKKIKK